MKQACLELLDPTKTAPENWTSSCVNTGHFVAALRGQEDHYAYPQEERAEVRKRIVLRVEEALVETLVGVPVQGIRRLRRVMKTEVWMTVQPSTVNGTGMGAQEWRDTLFLQYGLDPPDLLKYYNGCNANISIVHAHDCNRCGLD